MTNTQFRKWLDKKFGGSIYATAKALELDRDTVTALAKGETRKGNPYPVPKYVELACAAWTIGLRDYNGGRVHIG